MRPQALRSRVHGAPRSPRAFSLVELLIVVAVIGLLVALVAPALGRSRRAALDAVCVSNLRQSFTACRVFASDHDGMGPAIGQPYASTPNWALVVLRASGAAEPGSAAYREQSVLACPAASRALDAPMTRTYAMNGAGHNRQPWNADPDSYDDPPTAVAFVGVRLDRAAQPSRAALLIDSARNTQSPPLPADRCASVIDFRPDAAMADRIGRWHTGAGARAGAPAPAFNAAMLDGSVAAHADAPASFEEPLP